MSYTDPIIPVVHLPIEELDDLNTSICEKVQKYYKELLIDSIEKVQEKLSDTYQKKALYKYAVETLRSNLCHQPNLSRSQQDNCRECESCDHRCSKSLDADFA